MIITCGNCETSFNLNEKLLKPTGSKVRCSRCKHMFTAYPPAPPEVEQAVAETVEPEEIEEEIEAVEVPEPESTPEETGGMAAEAMESETPPDEAGDIAAEDAESEPSPEDAGDILAGVIEEADAEESADAETESAAVEEIGVDLDDFDLEFDIDTASVEKEDVAEFAADDVDHLQEAPSGELDVDLPDEATDEAQASAEVEDVMEEMDLSGIEESFDMEPAAEETPTEDAVIEELDLDLDIAPEGETPAEEDAPEGLDLDLAMTPEEEAPAEEDALDDLDLDLDLAMTPEEEAPTEEDTLDDLDLDLDLAMTPEEETPTEEDIPSEELDLSDIDLSMESESEPDTETDEDEPDLDLDLDLDLDSEPEKDSGLTEDEDDLDSEELDFSDFEETVMLDAPPIPETGNVSDDLDEELELDLDLEMADDTLPDAEPEPPSKEKEDVELEDLDFELDMELEGDAADDMADEDGEDVDLSDIEKMLEEDGEATGTVSLAPDTDDVETEVEKWKETTISDDLMDETGEIDLSDIMIDADDDDIEEDIEDVELELDIDEASEPGITAGGKRKPEEIDISGFEDFDIPAEGDQVEGDFSGGDIELEFEVDEDTDDLDGMATVSDFGEIAAGSETIEYSEPLVDVDEAPTKKKGKKKKIKKVKSARKSGIMRPVMLLLLLILLPLAAIILLDRFMSINVPYVTDYLKQVPYLNQVMKPEMKEVGEIRVDNISSKFIDNTKHGKLFIITGTVKNEFSESRRYIQVRGSLLSTGKTLAKEVTIYGGNFISDMDLAEMPLVDINKRLSNRFGDKKSNFDVKPGRAIPFMVVFSDLPESLEEFTIEAAGSFPVTTQQ